MALLQMKQKWMIGLLTVMLASIPVSYLYAFATITLNSQVAMDFDEIDYSVGASGLVNMGTNGAITYTGGLSGSGLGTAGSFFIRIANNNGSSINIGCDTSAVLTDNNGNVINLTDVEYVLGAASRTGFGGGIDCQGVGTTSNYNLSNTALRTVYIGGSLNVVVAPPLGGVFSTNNPGGDDIRFSVNF